MASTLLCQSLPPFPTELMGPTRVPALTNATERERSAYRTSTPPCAGCHTLFDAYGLALSNFDALGRFKSTDEQGRLIDPSVTLPAFVGAAQVSSASEMAAALGNSGRFDDCLAHNLLVWALSERPSSVDSEASLAIDGCATRQIMKNFGSSSPTFEDLLVQIATSLTLTERAAGAATP